MFRNRFNRGNRGEIGLIEGTGEMGVSGAETREVVFPT